MNNSLSLVTKNILLDWNRYFEKNKNIVFFLVKFFHNPGMFFSLIYRIENYLVKNKHIGIRLLGYFFYPLYFFITYFILDYHIEPWVDIEGGLFLHNRSIVITDNVTIGKNFSIMGQTTIGTGFDSKETKIMIGDDVKVGVGAKIICKNSINISDGVVIGANAVVVKSINHPKSVYVGVPAHRIK